jgi:lysozyme
MTTFGFDTSHFQPGLPVKDLPGEFLIARCSFGERTKDAEYSRFRKEAEEQQKLFAAYHFVTDGDPARQALNIGAVVRETSIPIMLDLEPSDKVGDVFKSRPTLQTAFKVRAELAKLGYHVKLLYLPGWYWNELGRPDLKGWTLVQSRYPSSVHNTTKELYTGDEDPRGWAPYGGVTPLLWQYASTAIIPGYTRNTVDADAFRGTRQELAARAVFADFGVQRRGLHIDAAIAELELAHPDRRPKVAEALRILKTIPTL